MNAYSCEVCDSPINKNSESYRGRMSRDMVNAIREKKPGFHVQDDLCLKCGAEFEAKIADAKKPAWMGRRLG